MAVLGPENTLFPSAPVNEQGLAPQGAINPHRGALAPVGEKSTTSRGILTDEHIYCTNREQLLLIYPRDSYLLVKSKSKLFLVICCNYSSKK